jgi:hypothetical protein
VKVWHVVVFIGIVYALAPSRRVRMLLFGTALLSLPLLW